MGMIEVTAKEACYTADNRYIEAGQVFNWFGDVEDLPDYLEPTGKARKVEITRERNFGTPDDRNMAILDALEKLDGSNDEHWTSDGQPRMDVVQDLLEDDTVTRAELRAIAPEAVRPPASQR